jgi:hypothetical protein
MKKLILIVLCLVNLHSFGQEYVWSEVQIIEPGDVNGVVCKIDITENDEKVVLGYFNNSLTIDSQTITSTKPVGVFLAKYSATDELLWLNKIAESDEISEITFLPILASSPKLKTDYDGNIFVKLYYSDSLIINSITYQANDSIESYRNFALLKYSAIGELIDHVRFEGSCSKGLTDFQLISDSFNNHMYMLGKYGNDVWGTTSSCNCLFGNDTLTTNSSSMYIAKLNELGEFEWIKTIEEPWNISPSSIAIIDENIYIAGSFSGSSSVIFDDYTLNIPSFYEFGGYIAKFDTSGVFQWAKHFGVNGWGAYVQVFDIQVLDSDNILLLGKSAALNELNQVFFQDAPTLSGYVGGKDEFFIVNYDSSGNVKWNRMSDSDGYEYASSMAVNSQKNIYITGKYSLPLYFGEDTLTPSGADDVFIAAYDSLGTELWATSAGGGSYDLGKTLKFDSQDNLYLCGRSYSSSLQFGELNYNLTEPSIFLAKLTPNDVGIEELLNQDILIELYPNPNTGAFSIRSEQNLEQLEIYNLLGEKVFEKHVKKSSKQIHIESSLITGVYFVLLKTEEGNYTAQKMIVE